jgi:hypothetical protein
MFPFRKSQLNSATRRRGRGNEVLEDISRACTVIVDLIEKVMVDEKTMIIKVRRGPLFGGDIWSSASEDPSDSTIELTAAVAFKRRGVETKLVLPGLAQRKHSSRCDPRADQGDRAPAWFEELAWPSPIARGTGQA